ncbi:MAG: glutamate--tRNA ligase [Patescibacteria group bacterium]
MKARTRIAPSPTGYMHIGTLHTALFNYFIARQTGGEFIIRIEDTDRERLVEGSLENLLNVFKELGLEHDEGPFLDKDGVIDEKGEFGPYTQSQRLDIYHQYINQLLDQGDAYRCFCTKERLEEMREAQKATKQTPKYDRTCCRFSATEVQTMLDAGEPYVVRMKISEGETVFEDEIRGTIRIQNSEIDDQVILKSDGFPTYHLAVVVDDSLMKITHVVRGEEWVPSTPKHVILYKMLGLDLPKFAHLPLLLNSDKTKLSKRQGDVAVEDYLTQGYLPEALLNFVGTLGFNPSGDREIYSIKELVEKFDLKKVNKSGAVMNLEKLRWMNNQYLQKLTDAELKKFVSSFIQADLNNPVVLRALTIEKTRADQLSELQEKIEPYLTMPACDPSILVWKKSDAADARNQLLNLKKYLEGVGEIDFESVTKIEESLRSYIEKNELQNGNVLWPLRVALSGREKSASPFEFLWVLGKEESLARIERASEILV